MRLFKYEMYRMLVDRTVWVLFIAILAFGMLMGYMGRGIYTGVPIVFITHSLLSNPLVPMWSSVVLAPVFFGLDFQYRTINTAICVGYRRWGIMLSKVIGYYLFGGGVLALSCLSAIWVRHGGFTLVSLEFWGDLFILTLLNLATLTIPMLASFIFRDVFASIATTTIFTYMMQNWMEKGSTDPLLRFYPPGLQLRFDYWSTWPGASAAVFTGIIYAAVGLLTIILIFRRRELK
jgi:hypothetical protein